MYLISSNETKLKEFKRILPEISILKGKDLKEVDGTPEEVIIYKSIEAGKNTVVEDTILVIDGKEIVDIKWKINQLKKLKSNKTIKAKWEVLIGYNNGTEIYIYKGVVNGRINPNSKDKGYQFDPFFIPNDNYFEKNIDNKSLAVLENENKKDYFSARKNALINFKNSNVYKIINIKDVPEWKGKYQNN